METLLRNFLLSLGRSRRARRMALKYGLRLGARRFVAGVAIRDAVDTVKRLNEQGKLATLDHLGEFVRNEEEARHAADMCLRTLDEIAAAGVQSNLSLKLTSIGLDIDRELCASHMRMILGRAKERGNFVRIDMEDYTRCQPALDLFRELRQSFDHVGIVIQAYLYRSLQDVRELASLRPNLRLVKGAYKESDKVAFPYKSDVDKQFMSLICEQLKYGYTAIATHDRKIIDAVKALVKEQSIDNGKFEFQMLYGIGENLQDELIREGYRVRIYVPYGEDWFGYFMRRLAERPANVWFLLKNMRN